MYFRIQKDHVVPLTRIFGLWWPGKKHYLTGGQQLFIEEMDLKPGHIIELCDEDTVDKSKQWRVLHFLKVSNLFVDYTRGPGTTLPDCLHLCRWLGKDSIPRGSPANAGDRAAVVTCLGSSDQEFLENGLC